MHAPPGLLIAAAVLGVVVPVVINGLAFWTGNAIAVMILSTISLAAVPLVVARVAYRQGYDHGSAYQSATADKANLKSKNRRDEP